MNATGWIVFCLTCLILIAVLAVLKFVRHVKMLPLVITAVVLVGIGVGAYFGLKSIFPNKTEEPVIEEVIEKPVEEAVEEG